MDAKTLLDWFTNAPEGSQPFYAIPEAGRATLRSALSLAAAVEGPEDATPETDSITDSEGRGTELTLVPSVFARALERQRTAALRALKAERERAGKMAEQIRAQGQWAPIGLRDALMQWEASAPLAAQERRT